MSAISDCWHLIDLQSDGSPNRNQIIRSRNYGKNNGLPKSKKRPEKGACLGLLLAVDASYDDTLASTESVTDNKDRLDRLKLKFVANFLYIKYEFKGRWAKLKGFG